MNPRRDEALWRWVLAALVAAAALAAFAPALDCGFVSFDDGVYITENPGIRGFGSAYLRWMLTGGVGGLWQPLTLLSLAVDYRLWALDPWGFHFTNVVLHAGVAVLFYFLCLRLFLLARPRLDPSKAAAGAALAALFFAVHPLRVESVAWATERKDVLSGIFLMATVLLRLKAAASTRYRREAWELAALFAYALSLLAKAVGVTLPAVLLILEIYPLRRLSPDPRTWREGRHRQVLARLAPYFVFAGATLAFSVFAAKNLGVIRGFGDQGTAWRAGQALYGLFFYPVKTLWPSSLCAYYPPAPWFGRWSLELLARLALAAAALGALWRYGSRRPAVAAAVLAYVAMYLPMSGLLQMGMLFGACDRYTYLPCLGLAALFGAAFIDAGRAARLMAVAWLVVLGVLSREQCATWRDSATLWSTAAARAPSGFALSNLGVALMNSGRPQEGFARIQEAVDGFPERALGYDNLGVAFQRLGQERRARETWMRGLEREDLDDLHERLGASLAAGDGTELVGGIAHLRAAVARCPLCAPWRADLAEALMRGGAFAEAEAQYAVVLSIEPWLGRARNNWGLLLARRGLLDAAVLQYRLALRSGNARAEANYNWGNVLLGQGRLDEAERRYREALRLDARLAQAQVNLGNIRARRGRLAEAAGLYRAALKTSPGLVEARANLAAVRRALGR